MRTRSWLIVGLLACTLGPANEPSLRPETITVLQPATEQQVASVAEAARAFKTAGLALPDVEVAFSNDERHCNGHLGLFQSARRPWRITICSDLDFVPVHELAHAWIEANIDGSTRSAYVQYRNKRSWNSPQHAWGERGVEDAAFIIQQNLTAQFQGALSDEWQRRASAYELLVGTTSPLLDSAPTEAGDLPRNRGC